MRIIRGHDTIPTFRHAVATIGSYDGVHRGHSILLGEVAKRARQQGGESVVITFEPHPRITLHNDEGLYLLSTLDEKAQLLERCGIEYMVVIEFTLEFSLLSHKEFVEQWLINRLNIKELVVGYNHHFGHDKQGNYQTLTSHGALSIVEIAQHRADGDKISSTIIRHHLTEGDIATATRLLGHPYLVIGQCDNEGIATLDRYKLLPPPGHYLARVNDISTTVEVLSAHHIGCAVEGQNVKIEFL